MNKILSLTAILAAVVLATGCASVGPPTDIPVLMPGGQKATIVAHNQRVPDFLLAKDKLALNYIRKGEMSENQLAAVSEAERACRIYTDTVRPSNFVSIMSSTGIYALAGWIGVGLGSQAFSGVHTAQYAQYGMWASGTAGAANGAMSLGGQTFTFENCGRDLLTMFPEYNNIRVIMKSPY